MREHGFEGWVWVPVLLFVLSGLPAHTASRPAVAPACVSSSACLPLPVSGNPVNVAGVAALVNAVNNAAPFDTILIADGVYELDGAYLLIQVPNVTLRSASGNRSAVVLDGNYITGEIVQVAASNVTIADVTLREAYYHPIHVVTGPTADTLNTLIYNVHIIDPGEQAVKINPSGTDYFPDNGTIACSRIELTDTGRPFVRNDCYTGGVDAHQARGWVIRDNVIEGFWCDAGLSEHGIHLWKGCRDTLVERNELSDNARGIGFGLADSGDARTYVDDPCPGAGGGYVDHYGGIIRSNTVFVGSAPLFSSEFGFDCGICLWQACGAQVLHNTVASTLDPFSSIEWRFANTDVEITNNLVTFMLRDRGGSSRLAGNLEYQPLSLFVDGATGNLHLAGTATAAMDQAVSVSPGLCGDDVDGDPRPLCGQGDVGADEYVPLPPPPVGNTLFCQTAAGDVALQWQSAVGEYNLYRDEDKRFAAPDRIQPGLTDLQTADTGAVAPPPQNPGLYFYQVRAVGACGIEE